MEASKQMQVKFYASSGDNSCLKSAMFNLADLLASNNHLNTYLDKYTPSKYRKTPNFVDVVKFLLQALMIFWNDCVKDLNSLQHYHKTMAKTNILKREQSVSRIKHFRFRAAFMRCGTILSQLERQEIVA